MVRKRRQLCALLLSAVVFSAQLPAVVMAENDRPADGSIVSFAPLDSGVAEQTVDMGTELSMLGLPDKVTATVYYDAGNGGGSVPAGSAGDASGNSIKTAAQTGVTATEEIPVTWGGGEPPYDGGTPGRYVFTAHADGYELSGGAEPPAIIVTVTEDAVKKPGEITSEGPLACRISGGGVPCLTGTRAGAYRIPWQMAAL